MTPSRSGPDRQVDNRLQSYSPQVDRNTGAAVTTKQSARFLTIRDCALGFERDSLAASPRLTQRFLCARLGNSLTAGFSILPHHDRTRLSSVEALKRLAVPGDLEIEYRVRRCSGDSRRLIVLLHGVASNMTRWSELVEQTTLTESWDVIRIDLRGHGKLPWRGRLNMEAWCDDLVRLLDQEQSSRAFFIGHSLGAQIAVYFAHWHPTRTAGLVLIDPVLSGTLLGNLRVASRFTFLLTAVIIVIRLLNRIGIHRRRIPSRDLRALDEETREQLLANGRAEEFVERYGSVLPDLKHFPTANFLQEIVQMVRPLPDLYGIAAPVLVVLSRGATYTNPEATRDGIKRLPHPTIVNIDAYHWPLTEKPDETRRAIESWFADLDCD